MNEGTHTYRIIFCERIEGVSCRRRIALCLKPLYWGDRAHPKDWYWFEGKIKLIEVPERVREAAVDLICSNEIFGEGEWVPSIITDLQRYKGIDAILSTMQNVPDNWYTIYAKFP